MAEATSAYMFGLANPSRFLGFSRAVLPWLAGLTLMLFAVGLTWALVYSPPDYQQSETVRIMYVHVPAAWLAMLVYAVMAAASFTYVVWRHALAEFAAAACAPIGAAFTGIALATGMLWGKPMWGTYWQWDARLTSVLLLFFIYLGLIALRRSLADPQRAANAAAVLTLIGGINLPIIKFSVDWWNTLHQGASVIRFDGPTIDPAMLLPLILMALAYLAFFFLFLLLRVHTLILEHRMLVAGRRAPSRPVAPVQRGANA